MVVANTNIDARIATKTDITQPLCLRSFSRRLFRFIPPYSVHEGLKRGQMPPRRGLRLSGMGSILRISPLVYHGLPLVVALGSCRVVGGLEEVRTSDTNRCSDSDFSVDKFETTCGAPLSSPCFDFSRCDLSPLDHDSSENTGGGGPKIYVYDHGCSLSDSASISLDGREDGGPALESEKLYAHELSWVFRNAAAERGVLAETYDSACAFIHVSWGEKEPCAVKQPLWHHGSNHVMVNFGDKGRWAKEGGRDEGRERGGWRERRGLGGGGGREEGGR